MEQLKQAVRGREQQCVAALLELFRFRPDDYEADTVPVERGRWGMDLLNPASLKQFGIGRAAAPRRAASPASPSTRSPAACRSAPPPFSAPPSARCGAA